MKRLLLLALLCSTSVFAACPKNPPATPVAMVADAGTKVEQSGSAILTAAQTAAKQTNPVTNAPLISTQQLDDVSLVCDKLGRLGTRLAQLLTDYQAAKAAGSSTAALALAIQAIVADATSALQSISHSIPNGTVAAIDSAVTAALGLYAQIKAGVL